MKIQTNIFQAVFLTIFVGSTLDGVTANSVPVSESCLRCLMAAATPYSALLCPSNLCGPFYIDEETWKVSGKFTSGNESPTSPTAYKNCVYDTHCSVATLRAFLTRYADDCNDDGVINCDDYAHLYFYDLRDCHQELPEDFRSKYQECNNIG